MATVTFGLTVTKKTNADQTAGLIPMTNSMVEKAVNTSARSGTNSNGICVDDNGNAVCQIYKIEVVSQICDISEIRNDGIDGFYKFKELLTKQ
jgi:hypothetical protein